MKYIIGIDGGTQSTKVGIYDLEGNVVCQARKELRPLYVPDADTAEHPEDDLWDSLKAVCSEVMEQFQGDAQQIIGIGLGSIRCCRVYLKQDGTLAYPVINWMDRRLSKPYQKDLPETAYITTTTGYLTHRLTGEKKDTAANYEGVYGPLDRENWKWSEDAQDYIPYNLTRKMLFDLVLPGDELGKITKKANEETGLPEGCPVYATANDKAAEALGAGLYNEDSVLVSLGTYIGGMMKGDRYIDAAKHYWTNLADVPYEYLYETTDGIRRGMWSITWFKELLGKEIEETAASMRKSVEDLLEEEAKEIAPGSEGLITVGEFLAPNSAPYRKALFIGLDGRHKRAHMYRSIMESIAMTMEISVKNMCNELEREPERLIISGGGSNSDLFMQIFADVFGMKTVRNVISNTAGMGAAINAAVGAGCYADYKTAVEKMVKIKDAFEPNQKHHDLYEKVINEVYADIKDYIDPVNQKIHSIFG